MAEKQVVLISVGMMTAVGLTAPETAASVRAALTRLTEREFEHIFDPIAMAEVIDDGLPDLADDCADDPQLSPREARLLRLGSLPLLECLAPLPSETRPPGLILAPPEIPGTPPVEGQQLLKRLARQTGGAFDASKSHCSSGGRAGGLLAIEQAARVILEGTEELMLVGGIDCFCDSSIVELLHRDGRLLTMENFDGFAPGEGAAFLLLAEQDVAERMNLAPLGQLSAVARGFEQGHLFSDDVYLGDGLAGTLEEFFSGGAVEEPIREVYATMNGENHWGKEWGVAFLRNKGAFEPEHQMHHPADCFGDTGAASGPLLVALAGMGISEGYRRSPALVYGSSDRGDRAALAVSAA